MEFKKQMNKGTKKERGKPRNRVLTTENKLIFTRGEESGRGGQGWVNWWKRLRSTLLISTGLYMEVLNYYIVPLKII